MRKLSTKQILLIVFVALVFGGRMYFRHQQEKEREEQLKMLEELSRHQQESGLYDSIAKMQQQKLHDQNQQFLDSMQKDLERIGGSLDSLGESINNME
jgi:uncharacterized protein HemX